MVEANPTEDQDVTMQENTAEVGNEASEVPQLVQMEEESKEESKEQQEEQKQAGLVNVGLTIGDENVPQVRQPHHQDEKAGTTNNTVLRQYAQLIEKAATILICNYSSLNYAINMGFAARKQVASDLNDDAFAARRGQVNEVKALIGGDLLEQPPQSIAARCQLINMLLQLLMDEDIEKQDLIELLDDHMEEHFNVVADDQSHRDIATLLMKVRNELSFCAQNDLDLPSGSLTIKQLTEFNERNRGNVQIINQAARNAKDDDSSGFEDNSSGDDDDWSSDSDDGDGAAKDDKDGKKKGGAAAASKGLDDSFEEVVDKKKRKR